MITCLKVEKVRYAVRTVKSLITVSSVPYALNGNVGLRYANPTYMAADKLKQLAGLVDGVFQLMPSGKHMVGGD